MTAALFVTVVLAGAIGAVLRYGAATALAGHTRFPYAVLVVNTVGSAIGGAALALADAGVLSADLRLVILTGFCGGLTTFSTFSVETIELVLAGRRRVAALNVLGNVALGIGAAAIAFVLTSILVR